MSFPKFDRHGSNGNGDGNRDGHKVNVMLVDDDPAFLRLTEMLLQTHYADEIEVVGTAKTGEECLTLAQLLAPEVILMDLNMPGMGGLGTIPLLHILFPQTRIIALTSDDTARAKRLVLAAGGHDLVSKTELKTNLIPAIESAMKEESMRD